MSSASKRMIGEKETNEKRRKYFIQVKRNEKLQGRLTGFYFGNENRSHD